jgi:hypothetical protein
MSTVWINGRRLTLPSATPERSVADLDTALRRDTVESIIQSIAGIASDIVTTTRLVVVETLVCTVALDHRHATRRARSDDIDTAAIQ